MHRSTPEHAAPKYDQYLPFVRRALMLVQVMSASVCLFGRRRENRTVTRSLAPEGGGDAVRFSVGSGALFTA